MFGTDRNIAMNEALYSIVVPLYRSQAHLPKLIDFIRLNFSDKLAEVQLILVVDGDNENYTFGGSLKNFGNTRIIYLKKNYGQYIATLCGLAEADGQAIITMDADMHGLNDIFTKTMLSENTDGFDLVYTEFKYSQRGLLREVGTRFYNGIISRASKKEQHGHSGSSFRIITSALKDKLLAATSNASLIDINLLKLADKINFVEMPVGEEARSSYSLMGLVGMFAKVGLNVLFRSEKRAPFLPDIYISNSSDINMGHDNRKW